MKKIRSRKELEAEKKRLRQKQEDLENKFRSDWEELKKNAGTGDLGKNIFHSWLEKKKADLVNRKSILQSMLSYGAALTAKRMMEKAGEKWNKIFTNR